MAIKIFAAADLHLGKRSSGLFNDGRETATKFAWQQIVDRAIIDKVDILLLSGDVIDRDNRYYEAIGPLQAGFEKLAGHGIKVYMVSGNHDFDVLAQIVDAGRYSHVHLLGRNGQWQLASFTKNGQTIQFIGWSFPRQHMIDSALANVGTIEPDRNYPCIGLLHADLDNPGSLYNPVSSNDLDFPGISVWLLGHVHKPMIRQLAATSICYPGSPQALSAKEPGMHGLIQLLIEDDYSITITPVAISTVRYEKLTIDISQVTNEQDLRARLHFGLTADAQAKLPELENVLHLIYDIQLSGEHPAELLVYQWAEQIKNDYEVPVASGSKISVRHVSSAIQPAVDNLEELSRQPTPAGMLASVILAIQKGETTPLLDELSAEWVKAHRDLETINTYHPLQLKWQQEKPDTNARDYILRESGRLLSQLLQQTR